MQVKMAPMKSVGYWLLFPGTVKPHYLEPLGTKEITSSYQKFRAKGVKFV